MSTSVKARQVRSKAAASWRLQLRQAGRFESAAGAPVDLEPKDALLLAYLAVEGATPRSRLAALLWPDVEDERARGNLRQRLLRLKRTTGVELVTGNPQARLAVGVGHDLDRSHELLAGIGLEQAGGLAEWLETQRERRRRARSAELAAAIAQAQAAGDHALGLQHANGLLELDPWSEEAHRQLMRLHYLRGDAGAAMAAYERCVRLLQEEFGARPSKETLQLRSQIESLPAEPAAASPRTVPVTILRPPRLIGRDAEWTALQAAWTAGGTAVVLGEAGMGKTRLVTDFANSRGRAAVVCSRPGDERVVYALATRMLRHLPRDAMAGLDGAVRKELARLLPEFGDAEPLRSDAERARFCNAVGAALEQAAVELAGVVVDDLHFADEASVELIHYLCGDSRLCWIFAGRPAQLGAAARALVDALTLRSPETVLHLAPLTPAQLAEFVASLGLDGMSADEHVGALMRHTGGNPMFVLETIKARLTQRGSGPPGRLPTVDNVRALISQRVGHLTPEAVRLARCAAIAGQDFSADVAAHVLGVRPLDLVDAWSELEGAQVFRDGAFAHDIIGEVALASVPPPIARQLHREIAQYLDERNGEPARVAGHWLAAEKWGRAGAALMQAASRSGAARRWREAEAQLDEAARCFERADDRSGRFEALLARSEVLVYCDLGDESLACARAAQLSAVTDDERLRGAAALIGLLAHRGEAAEVVASGTDALELARTCGDRAMEMRLATRVSGSLCNLQRIPEALAILEPMRNWVDAHAEPAERAEYYMALGFALDLGSFLGDAVRALEASCQAARDAGLDVALAEALSNLATAHAKLGRVRRAADLGRQAIELMRGDSGVAGRSLQSQCTLAHRLRDLGHYAEALPLFEESLAHFRAAGSRFWVASTAHRLALAWMQLGQFARAQRLLAEDPGDPAPRSEAMWAACRAELARLQGAGMRAEPQQQIRFALQLLGQWPDDGAYRMVTLFATAILPAEEGEPLATDLAAWANARERFGMALAAHVRAAARALEQDAPRRALPHVEAALRLAPEFDMDSVYRGELWWVAHRTYAAVGDEVLARRVLDEGVAWVRSIAQAHVAPEYRDSFLNRNPVNRELLRFATILK